MKHLKMFEDFSNEAYEDHEGPTQAAYKTQDDIDDEEREFRREFNAKSKRKKEQEEDTEDTIDYSFIKESEGTEDGEEFNEDEEDFDDEEGFEDGDYSEASWNMDKFMYDDPDVQEDFYEILYRKDLEELTEFIQENIQDEDRFHSYVSDNGTVRGFAQWLIDNISEGEQEN